MPCDVEKKLEVFGDGSSDSRERGERVGDIVLEDPISVGDSANLEAARDRLIGDGVTD
jgi:hypothetical protein